MITRRNFIQTSLQTSALLAADFSLGSFANKQQHSIGVLLGTVEKFMTEDADATLKKIAAIGFKEIEYPRTYGYAADNLKSIIKKYKLTSLGGGENITNLTNHFAVYVQEYNEMGKQYVFCYWGWFDNGKNKTIEDWKKQCDILNKLGEKYRQQGLRLAYHNHDIEFAVTENQIPYDVLLQNTNPEFICFEMDIWWIVKGGANPLDFIAKYPGRFEVCHIKTAGLLAGNEEAQNLNYKEVLSNSAKAGLKHFILENEPGIENPFNYFEKSYAYIKGILQ